MTEATGEPGAFGIPVEPPIPEAVAAATRAPEYRWILLWRWPLRLTHWVSAITIVMLIATGFYIGRPYFMTGGEASSHFMMGWARFLHFTAAALIIGAAILRIYWLFAGNRYARWNALFPIKRRDLKNLIRMLRHYLFISQERAPNYLGHHPLQQLSYTGIYLVVIVQVCSGFYLYGLSNPGGWIYTLFAWVGPLLGGVQVVRFVHHALTWILIAFVPLHVYLAFRSDVVDREGEMSSIFSGGRFVRADQHFEDE